MVLQIKKQNIKIFYSTIITTIWLLVIYFIKGVFPFGSGTIIDGDLYQGGVPSYFYLWDIMHGGNLIYDFTTACGFERLTLFSVLNPANWFLFFIPRSAIVNAMSILLVIKFSLISFTSSFSFSKIFDKLSTPWLLIVSLMYTFCGYNLQYFTNIDWLDAVAIYPLIVLFALNMLKGKSKVPYVVALSYLLIFNTYMAFFVVISLIVFGGLYIFIVEKKENRKKDVLSLGIGTGVSLLASAYHIYGFAMGVLNGARFNMGIDAGKTTNPETMPFAQSVLRILNSESNTDLCSALMFLGTEIAAASIIWLVIKSIKNKELRKYSSFFGITMMILLIQRFCLATDLFWHLGSHVMFPYRNGYMVGFFAALAVAFCFSNEKFRQGLSFKRDLFNLLVPIFAVFSVILFVQYGKIFYSELYKFDVLSSTLAQQSLTFPYTMFSCALVLPIFILLLMKYKRFKNTVLTVIVVGFITANSYLLIGHSGDFDRVFDYRSYYSDCSDVSENITDNDFFERVNNPDMSLITNYPYISNVSSISNWTHSLSQNQMQSLEYLGFSTVYTRTLDIGGTEFSKALLRITDSISKNDLEKEYYEKVVTSKNGINYYSNKLVLPVGVVADESVCDIEFDNVFSYQNNIYKSISGDNEDLFDELNILKKESSVVNPKEYISDDEEKLGPDELILTKITAHVEGQKSIYISAYNENYCVLKISVNNKTIPIYNMVEQKITGTVNQYPTGSNNNALCLGTFNDCDVEITYLSIIEESKNVALYGMDTKKLVSLCESYSTDKNYTTNENGADITIKSNREGIAFIPLSYSNNWNITVNGEKVLPVCVLGNFLGVNIKSGESQIKLRYSYTPLIKTIAFTLLSIIVGTALLIIDKKIKQKPKFIETISFVLFKLICLSAYLILYVVPIGFCLLK